MAEATSRDLPQEETLRYAQGDTPSSVILERSEESQGCAGLWHRTLEVQQLGDSLTVVVRVPEGDL